MTLLVTDADSAVFLFKYGLELSNILDVFPHTQKEEY